MRLGLPAPRKRSPALFADLAMPQRPWDLERGLWQHGFNRVAGIDEAGRGPLAGPVVAAAVILDERHDYPGVNDSKKMTPAGREAAFRLILRRARAVGLGLIDHQEIDRTDILRATLKAMRQAVSDLEPAADYLLVDGSTPFPSQVPQKTVPKGDQISLSIGAASILAKVTRDRIMIAYDRLFPQYGFAVHKGYATKIHLDALARYGPCPIHRLTYKRVGPRDDA